MNNIDIKLIKSLNPCQDRLNNAIKYYKYRSVTKAQFMGLRNITQQDKLWVAFRLMPKDNIKLAAADIAELVLHIYEAKYPNDFRPRKAIEAARNKNDAANAAYTANAAYDAANAACAAANAANAAYAAANAAYATTYAASYAANAATYAAKAASNNKVMEKQIRKIVLKYWNKR